MGYPGLKRPGRPRTGRIRTVSALVVLVEVCRSDCSASASVISSLAEVGRKRLVLRKKCKVVRSSEIECSREKLSELVIMASELCRESTCQSVKDEKDDGG